MDLGLCLDDELFERKEVKSQQLKQQPYNVKVCEKGWPFNCPSPSDTVQRQNITKFQADFWYRNGQYDKALEAYTFIHTNPQVASTTVERDVTESVIRCHLKLEHFDAALELLSHLIKKQSEDTSLLLLLAKICSATCNVQSEITCYKKCILLHSYNHNFWYSLAAAYDKVQESIKTCKHTGNNHDNKHLNECIDTLLQSSTAVNDRDCLKLHLNCIHCKCEHDDQELVLVDKVFLSLNDHHEQLNHHTSNSVTDANNLNEIMTEKLTIKKKFELPSLAGYEFQTKSCLPLQDGSSSRQVNTKLLDSRNTDEKPYVTIGMNSEDSEDNKSCDFNMTIQHFNHKMHQSGELSSASRDYTVPLFVFFCLLRTRFLLQRAIWTSSSFVKEKLMKTMSEVKELLKKCVLCQCGELKKCILKQLETDDVHLAGQQLDDLDMHTLYQGGSTKHWT